MKSFYIISILCFLFSGEMFSQAVSINSTGNPPDPSAMLDVQSDNKGMLFPRMTTIQRQNIPLPVKGLIVYDTNTLSFWFRTTTDWVELTDNFHGLRDKDNDTKVQVEESPDEDIIRFDIGGVEAMVLRENTQAATRLEIGPDSCLIIGYGAGKSSVASGNTILGYEAGQNNSTGNRNVLLGFRAGKNNGALQNRNVLIGYEAGINNNSSFNTLIGYQSGLANTAGANSTFLGYSSGLNTTTGVRNIFIGSQAGLTNTTGHNNTFLGSDAGYYSNGLFNTFIGSEAGYVNRLGSQNTVIGYGAAGNHFALRDLGNSNSILGFQAGYSSVSIAENVLMGYRAGYSMTTGANNVMMGFQSGYSSTTARSNVSIGSNALRNNLTGNANVALGDSTLFNNTTSNNVALGSKAGMGNTTGGSNTFVGKNAGTNNSTASFNTMLGSGAGQGTKTGGYNTFIGGESAIANSSGANNSFLGYASGFRNTTGSKNIFIGDRAAEFNLSGSSNIAIGTSALTRNDNGSFNIAIGDQALGDPLSEETIFYENIAIGREAGRGILNSQNIIVGNKSGIGMDGHNSVLFGNNIEHFGSRNTYLGSETGASILYEPIEATAIGYGTTVLQDYSVIVGDPTRYWGTVGIGTATPDARLHVEGQGLDAFQVSQNGSLKLSVGSNGKVVAHNELLVNTTTGKPGYKMSVDGSIACEELLVQNSTDWPDYVFADNYELMDLDDLQTFLRDEKHLPGIPSAREVADNGVKVGDLQRRMLEKIEELTLYVIELESRLQQIENK